MQLKQRMIRRGGLSLGSAGVEWHATSFCPFILLVRGCDGGSRDLIYKHSVETNGRVSWTPLPTHILGIKRNVTRMNAPDLEGVGAPNVVKWTALMSRDEVIFLGSELLNISFF